MFERFTDKARRIVVVAQEEARILNHNYIGTEHIVLALTRERESIAVKALESLSISLDALRSQVVDIIGQGEATVPKEMHIPFTPRAKKVLELSLREALQLGHNYVGTEHILLGLAREGEGVAAQVLVKFGADLSGVRQKVIELLSSYSSPEVRVSRPSEVGAVGPSPTGAMDAYVAATFADFTEDARAVVTRAFEAAYAAGPIPINSGHLLVGLCGDSELGHSLLEQGIATDAAMQAVVSMTVPLPPALEALTQDLDQARTQKLQAVKAQDFEKAGRVRDRERELIAQREAMEQDLYDQRSLSYGRSPLGSRVGTDAIDVVEAARADRTPVDAAGLLAAIDATPASIAGEIVSRIKSEGKPRVFLSYRRRDAEADAGRLYDALINTVGRDRVFKDVDNIPVGANFAHAITSALEESAVLVAVIGPSWTNEDKPPDDGSDFVLFELETAMRLGVPLLPVLVRGASMPQRTVLPPGLHEFPMINAAKT